MTRIYMNYLHWFAVYQLVLSFKSAASYYFKYLRWLGLIHVQKFKFPELFSLVISLFKY